MWTHVQVTVQKAKGLLSKGKNGTNDVFVTIGLGKEKYQTSVKERATDPVSWNEECELAIPKQGNKAEIVLTALHRNFIGDEFLGLVNIPLADFDGQDNRSRSKWYVLKSKPGKEKTKYRGELEVRVVFSNKGGIGSLSDLREKEPHHSSFGKLASSLGGSFLSLRKEKKGLKSFTKSVGQKVSTLPGRGAGKHKEQLNIVPEQVQFQKVQSRADADPGVISDDEDEFKFEELSHKSSKSSLGITLVTGPTAKTESYENLGGGEFIRKNFSPPSPLTIDNSLSDKKNRWNTENNSTDDWEKKLFGRNSPAPNPRIASIMAEEDVKKPDSPLESTTANNETFKFSKTTSELSKDAEPVPKPRLIHDKIKQTEQVLKSHSMEDVSSLVKPKLEEKVKKKHTLKETLFHHSSKSKDTTEEKQKGTPVGISKPIQMKDSHQETRLTKETLRKFDGKTRDDLIETITILQSAVDQQKLKMNEMEDYIDNLLVRVMETKPTILQYNCRPIK